MRSRAPLLLLLLTLLIALLLFFRWRAPSQPPSLRNITAAAATHDASNTAASIPRDVPSPRAEPTADAWSVALITDVTVSDAGSNARPLINARWGSGPEQLGHDLPQEANPEGPMSLASGRNGETLVLDQVNRRIVRFGADGRAMGSITVPLQGAQDVVTSDGSLVVMDRLSDRTVALLNNDGTVRARLPLEGTNLTEGGAATGLFVDGNNVYVEREHGALVRVGDTDGNADTTRDEIPGRPTRDGLSYLTAGLIDRTTGRFYVNSIARESRQHRYTRALQVQLSLMGIVLLDTDRAGVIYVAVLGEQQGATEPIVALLCLEPSQGRPTGQIVMPANTTPEETFRDLAVLDDGGVLYAHRTEQGVTVRRYDCR